MAQPHTNWLLLTRARQRRRPIKYAAMAKAQQAEFVAFAMETYGGMGKGAPLPTPIASAVLNTHRFPDLPFRLDRIGALANGDCAISAALYSARQHHTPVLVSNAQAASTVKQERIDLASYVRSTWSHDQWIAQVPLSARQPVWCLENDNNSYSTLQHQLRKPGGWLFPLVLHCKLVFHPFAVKHNVDIFLLSLCASPSPLDNKFLTLWSSDNPISVSSYNVRPEITNNIILLQTSITTPVPGEKRPHVSQHYESIIVNGAAILQYDHHLIQVSTDRRSGGWSEELCPQSLTGTTSHPCRGDGDLPCRLSVQDW
jgi:hypothetical protein